MGCFTEKNWYSAGAKEASLEYGLAAKEIILAKMEEILQG